MKISKLTTTDLEAVTGGAALFATGRKFVTALQNKSPDALTHASDYWFGSYLRPSPTRVTEAQYNARDQALHSQWNKPRRWLGGNRISDVTLELGSK